ncbi:hypothetical protein [Flammeovirga agarivorans]|uniref:Uncharacterized protein n=1 Tax=Flammeovirga agarivorans TaxID=2726742 RepID=A0A7X8SKY4_9BACT|nr:hypothetical protein [Flammeovirga agarivorans]NLR92136.1 hypothetical protein [Flammeovirga agarivorans]
MNLKTTLLGLLLTVLSFSTFAQDVPAPTDWQRENTSEYIAFVGEKWDLSESQKTELYDLRLDVMTHVAHYKKLAKDGDLTPQESKAKIQNHSKKINKEISELTGKDWKQINKINQEFWKHIESK